MDRYRHAAALTLAFAVAIAAGMAAAQAADAPDEMTGTVNVGDKAPDFTLKSYDGKEYTLSELVKDGPTALIFYRSAYW